MMLLIAVAVSLIFPLLFLLALRTLDLHKTAKFQRNVITMICGGLAYALAAQINPAMVKAGWATWDQVIRIAAPILEELLKSLILIYLVARADFNYVVDGALYGFGAGIGFAMLENIEYVMGNVEIALLVAVARVFSTNLMHATGSGLIGTALAYRRGEASLRGAWAAAAAVAGGYVLAIVVHAAFNTMASAGVYLALVIAYGVLGAGLIWGILRRGMNTQKEWVKEKLGLEDRVTKEEMRAVSGIEQVSENLFKPFKERFGGEKVPLLRELLYKQAEIGIKRKLLEVTPSPAKQKELQAIIERLSKEMNDLRKRIGMYEMMFVRQVYLEQDVRVWETIQARIAETSTGQKGGGLFDRATERIKEKSIKRDVA